MTYRLIIFDERVWERDCSRIPKKDLTRIIEKIGILGQKTTAGNVDVKKLQHHDSADFRLRVGDYRVLFNKNEETESIFLLRVLHRSKSYR